MIISVTKDNRPTTTAVIREQTNQSNLSQCQKLHYFYLRIVFPAGWFQYGTPYRKP